MSRRGAIGAAAVAAATAALFVVSRGKWSDAIIDSGREWIVPDALSRGELLYRDVVYWFGPFTPYFHAAFFRLLGSGFVALVVAGAVGAAAALAALRLLLRRVTGPSEANAWTVLAIPVLVFMPNAGGPILGMGYRMWHAATFALLAVALAASPSRRRHLVLLGGGACVALAGLCRTEWGLAALGAASLTLFVRRRNRRRFLREFPLLAASAVIIFGSILGGFILAAGVDAVLVDCHVLLAGLPEETRSFLLRYSGLPDWRHGILELVYSSAALVGVYLLIETLVSRKSPLRLARLGLALGACLAVLVLSALFGGASGAALFSAAPLASLAALCAGLWRRRGSGAAALAGAGALGVILSYRRLFHIGDAAYVGPPLLFAFVGAAGLLRLGAARPGRREVRRRLERSLVGLVATLAVMMFVARVAFYAADERVPVPGTGGMLSARPELVARIVEAASLIRSQTPAGSGLAVFPEGEILNYLSDRRNPSRYKLYIPGYLSSANEQKVLADLRLRDPAAIAIFYRLTSEYGPSLFGEDYGHLLMEWLRQTYELSSVGKGDRIQARNGAWLRVGVRK